MKNNIVIIGTGNMGKRHLQACAKSSDELEVICFDSNNAALQSVPEFCQKNNIKTAQLILAKSLTEVLSFIKDKTIVIVATTAQSRQTILAEVIKRKPLCVIAEKPLTQTLSEYESVRALASAMTVPVYINFTRHLYDFYQEIKAQLAGIKDKSMTAVFPNGIALIGIHMFELMTWLFNVTQYRLVESKVEEVFETKRTGYKDVYGELVLEIDGQARCVFSSSEQPEQCYAEIIADNRRYKVLERAGQLEITDQAGNQKIKNIKIPYTSQVLGLVINDIIKEGVTQRLPDIDQSYLAHKILFDYLAANDLAEVNIT